MDAVLQIFKRSICPGTPFFESLAKKPPTTMDDLFRRANKYSMLEDDVRAATQQVLVAGRPSRGNAERNAKPPDRPRPSDRRQEGPSRPDRPPLTPLSISYEKLLPMIQGLSDFRWPDPKETDPSTRDHSKRCAFHKEQVTRQNMQKPPVSGREAHQGRTSKAIPPLRCWRKNGTIIFPPVDPTRTLQPHRDALILSLEIGDFDVRHLVDPGSSADLVQASVVGHMGHSLTGLENPGRILSGFNGSQLHPWETLYCRSKLAQSLSTYNSRWFRVVTLQCHLRAHMATLHESHPLYISSNGEFPHQRGQIDLYGSQLAARQCYQIAREAGTSQEDAPPLSLATHVTNSNYWVRRKDPPAADPLQTIQISEENTHLTNIIPS
ncbi:hypothetical protein CK203_058325 [Vitis vinifera]|uniref:Reverse transcriptase/retrotransposon-derived protein RNase H-like domain-containing protein n=1 Tax=Vitis vinifera TaxID=29760 RepID=A0A438GE18_VITVI|nr:hypothetical protein CK203_058325 [Vitis vinifera]